MLSWCYSIVVETSIAVDRHTAQLQTIIPSKAFGNPSSVYIIKTMGDLITFLGLSATEAQAALVIDAAQYHSFSFFRKCSSSLLNECLLPRCLVVRSDANDEVGLLRSYLPSYAPSSTQHLPSSHLPTVFQISHHNLPFVDHAAEQGQDELLRLLDLLTFLQGCYCNPCSS